MRESLSTEIAGGGIEGEAFKIVHPSE